MLASNDVLDVIGEERLRVLRKAAVFAAMIGTFADGLPEPLVHQAAWPSAKSRRAFACRMTTKFPTRIIASYSSRSSGVSLPSGHLSASSWRSKNELLPSESYDVTSNNILLVLKGRA